MTCFWWQLANNITVHIIRLSLKKSCFEINVEKDPILCWLLSDNSFEIQVQWKQENLSANYLFLFVLESSQYPSRLYPEEVALLVGFYFKYPSTCYVMLRFEFPQINEVKNLIVNRGFPLEVFRSSKLLVVSSYFLG